MNENNTSASNTQADVTKENADSEEEAPAQITSSASMTQRQNRSVARNATPDIVAPAILVGYGIMTPEAGRRALINWAIGVQNSGKRSDFIDRKQALKLQAAIHSAERRGLPTFGNSADQTEQPSDAHADTAVDKPTRAQE